jgi:DnaK suppressor protein
VPLGGRSVIITLVLPCISGHFGEKQLFAGETLLDIDTHREKLLALKAATLAQIDSGQDSTKPVTLDQTMVGRVSRIDAIQQQEMARAAERRRHEYLGRIEAALQRIETGDFGYCVTCGEDIAPARLMFDPTLPTCIDCAGK